MVKKVAKKDNTPTKILISINCSLAPSPQSLIQYIQAQVEAKQHGIESLINVIQQTINGFLVGNAITNLILNDKSITHVFFGSDDTACDPDIFVKLISRDKDIISGVYRKRDPSTNQLAVYGEPGEPWDQWIKEGKLLRREFSSGHSMLIKRQVFETVAKKFRNLDYKDEDGTISHAIFLPYVDPKIKKIYLDDWAFSQRAKECGFQCWIDCSVKLKHRCEVWLGI